MHECLVGEETGKMEFRVHPEDLTPLRLAFLSGVVMLSMAIGTKGAAEDRAHDAHVHGLSRLNIAIEGNTVEMELLSPGANIVGFEHTARSAEDKALVARATAVLQNGEDLFAFSSGAGCRMEMAEVESALIDENDGDFDEHDTHENDEHSDEHTDEHIDERHDEHSEVEEHAEFHARYQFRCGQPERLEYIDVKLFEHFPGTNVLEVQTISPNGQSAHELTPALSRLNF